MPVVQGAVQLLPLMRIVYVTSFGSFQSALRALLGENLQPLIFLYSLLRQFWKVHLSSGSLIARRRLEL